MQRHSHAAGSTTQLRRHVTDGFAQTIAPLDQAAATWRQFIEAFSQPANPLAGLGRHSLGFGRNVLE